MAAGKPGTCAGGVGGGTAAVSPIGTGSGPVGAGALNPAPPGAASRVSTAVSALAGAATSTCALCGRRRQKPDRYLGNTFRTGALASRQVIPGAVPAKHQNQRNQEHPPTGNAVLTERHRKSQIRLRFESGRLCLEAAQDLAAVQTEVIAIGAHEADRVSRTRKQVRTPCLERR